MRRKGSAHDAYARILFVHLQPTKVDLNAPLI